MTTPTTGPRPAAAQVHEDALEQGAHSRDRHPRSVASRLAAPGVRRAAVALGLFGALAGGVASRAVAEDEPTGVTGIVNIGSDAVVGAEIASGPLGWEPRAGEHVELVRTDSAGRFELTASPLGPMDVWMRPTGGAWKFAIRMWNASVQDLQFDGRPVRGFGVGFSMGDDGNETATGVVKDAKGKPLAGASVSLRGDPSTIVLTDAKGAFRIEKASAGDGVLVRADGHRDQLGEFKSEKKPLSFKLAAAKPLTVKVLDKNNQPLAGAWVTVGDTERVFGTDGFIAAFPPRDRLIGGFTDATGQVQIVWGGLDDTTEVTAHARGHAPANDAVRASKGGSTTLQLGPARRVRAKVVLRGTDTPVPDVLVGLPRDDDGGPDSISALPAEQQRGPVVVGRSGDDGTCIIPHLSASVTTLRIVGDMKLRAEVKLEPVAD